MIQTKSLHGPDAHSQPSGDHPPPADSRPSANSRPAAGPRSPAANDTAPIYVTRPDLPDLGDFIPYLEQIWDSKVLTNGGPFHQLFEQQLCEYLGVEHIALFTNATIGLVTALQALRITGEVITTPYSFVATAHSLLWNGIAPVFVDVDADTLNIDPAKIEAAITPRTTAILAVHCYGHPCDVDAIQGIADRYNLRVIYDAAHAFSVGNAKGSVLRHDPVTNGGDGCFTGCEHIVAVVCCLKRVRHGLVRQVHTCDKVPRIPRLAFFQERLRDRLEVDHGRIRFPPLRDLVA